MRRWLTICATILMAGCGSAMGGTTARPTTTTLGATCHARGVPPYVLPDPVCTPGAVNAAVTPANVATTICQPGWARQQRPPAAYTNALKRMQMVVYGFHDAISAHEEDHLISLELGGDPKDPRNLWPEPGASPNLKDAKENLLKTEVCNGRRSLADAQHIIATDWTKAS